MERLTKRINGVVTYIGEENSYDTGQIAAELNAAARREILERLAAYEDTGLSPQACIEAGEIEAGLSAEDYSIHRMVELMRADKDGRLVVLPCKAGDTVYEVTSRKTISEYRVKAIRVELFCTFIEWDIAAGFVDKSIFGVPADEIGKTVFLTREEAEKTLEGKR